MPTASSCPTCSPLFPTPQTPSLKCEGKAKWVVIPARPSLRCPVGLEHLGCAGGGTVDWRGWREEEKAELEVRDITVEEYGVGEKVGEKHAGINKEQLGTAKCRVKYSIHMVQSEILPS